jgi:amino acid transporter
MGHDFGRMTTQTTQPSKQMLERGGIGLLGATTLGVVMLSPAMTLYGGFGPSYLNAGSAAPLAFVWALFATLPTAVSYILLSRDYPTSGSAADWAEKSFSKKIGIWAGWMVFLYYLTNFMIQPVTMGVFAGTLFQLIHVTPNFFTFALASLICLASGAYFVYRGISISSKGALAFLILETVVVTALCLSVLYVASKSGVTLSFNDFRVSASPTGSSGVFRAMVFAILAFCGFDVVSTLSEEVREPAKTIPRATFLSLLVYAGIIILGIWALTYGGSREELQKIAESGAMPISEVARKIWGTGGILIPITGISATFGLTIATAIGASRILFSMSRGGLAPAAFAKLNSAQTPSNALHLIFGLAIVLSLLTGALLGSYDAYVWWGTTSTFFAMVTYLFVNASNLVLNWRRWRTGPWAFFGYVAVPMIGLVTDAYLLYRTFFYELWGQGWATGQSVVVFDLACCLIAVVFAFRARTGIVSSKGVVT